MTTKKTYIAPQAFCYTFEVEKIIASSFIGGGMDEEGEADTQKKKGFSSDDWTKQKDQKSFWEE